MFKLFVCLIGTILTEAVLLSFQSYIFICFSDFNPTVDAPCFVSGWGSLTFQAPNLPPSLHYVSVPIVSQADCNKAYSNGITNNMICAGLEEGGKDSCQGDSGGPLVCMQGDNKPVITGVVSFGIGCAFPGFPGVYSKVTSHLSWIKRHMNGFATNLEVYLSSYFFQLFLRREHISFLFSYRFHFL